MSNPLPIRMAVCPLPRLRPSADEVPDPITGLTPSQAKRLIGSTQEELEADADEILADFAAAKKPADSLPSKPRPKKGAASDPDPGDLTGKERAAAAFRQFTRN